MNESSYTREFMVQLHGQHEWFALKLSDRFTKGIPDIIVNLLKTVVWLECKYVRKDRMEIVEERSYRVQIHNMMRLDKSAHALYVIWYAPSQMMELWQPASLFDLLQNGNEEQSPWDGVNFGEWQKLLEAIKGYVIL